MTQRFVLNELEAFLKLIGEQQNACALFAAATVGKDIGQGQTPSLEVFRKLRDVCEPVGFVGTGHKERYQGPGQGPEGIVFEFGAEAKMTESPATEVIEARRKACEHNGRFAGSGRADQGG